MALVKKEPVLFPSMCRYRLNRLCEKQKTSLSPRCISLLSERSSGTIFPVSNFGNPSRSQPSMEQLLLTTTETNLRKYGFQSCRRLPELSFTPVQLLNSPPCSVSSRCGKNLKSLGSSSNFGLQVISCQPPGIKDPNLEEDDLTRPKRKTTKTLRHRIPPIKQNETEYLQVVSSPPRIKKLISCNDSKTDRGKNLHNHLVCERFEMHMSHHLQRSKSEIVQKSYSAHSTQQLHSKERPMSSAAAMKSHSTKSPKFHRPLSLTKTSESGMGSTPPTSPEFQTEPKEADKLSLRSDFGKTSSSENSSSRLAASESRHETKLDPLVGGKKPTSRSADGSTRTVHNLSDKDRNYLHSVKDRLNLLPGEKKTKKEKQLKTFSGEDAKGLSALNNSQDFRPASYQGTINKQETVFNEEQQNINLGLISSFKDEKNSFYQNSDESGTEKEILQNNQISQDESSHVSKKEKKTNRISSSSSSSTLNEAKPEEDNPLTSDTDPDKKENGHLDNSSGDKDEGIHMMLEKPKLPSSQEKLKNIKRKSLKKLTRVNHPDIQNLLKPLPSHGHKQYFDPQEMAERRRKKLLEKMNQKKLLLDDSSPTTQPLFQDYGWLAKYCIFNKDNWKIYGRTFEIADTENKGWLTPKETMVALRTANSQLTPSEEEYLCRIIEMTGYSVEEGSDLRLFCILAALSHRITSLDNWMKSLIDNIDYRLLDMKTFKCKTLWECNVDTETNKISLEQLCVELRVGGVSLAHEQEAKDRLKHLKALDLLDFLTYIPLFIMIHESVVDNPLDFTRQK